MAEGNAAPIDEADYPIAVHVRPATENRNRLTTAFRFFLALPHIVLVGAPYATVACISWSSDRHGWDVGGGGGLLSVVIAIASLLAWIVLVIAARHPDALWRLSAWYLRWRVKAVAYMTLLRDEYPPFGDGEYSVELNVSKPAGHRSRLTVLFRVFLALPHLFLLSFLGVVWSFTTALAWAFILITGRYPDLLYGFALGMLAWTTRVEGYVLLLRDEYPPFTLRT